MKTEIPDFLIKMSRQINTQNNRITRDPIFVVCYDEKLTTAQGYQEDGSEWVGEDGYICDGDDKEALLSHLKEHHQDWFDSFAEQLDLDEDEEVDCDLDFDPEFCDLPEDITRWFYQKVRRPIKYCLTETDANAFIARKQHDYPELYTYVESMVFCPQMIQLREWIMSLTKESNQ